MPAGSLDAVEPSPDYRPKHVELIGIINKSVLLHLVGCLYYFIKWLALVKMVMNLLIS